MASCWVELSWVNLFRSAGSAHTVGREIQKMASIKESDSAQKERCGGGQSLEKWAKNQTKKKPLMRDRVGKIKKE